MKVHCEINNQFSLPVVNLKLINDIKQGGILLPMLLNLYMDNHIIIMLPTSVLRSIVNLYYSIWSYWSSTLKNISFTFTFYYYFI